MIITLLALLIFSIAGGFAIIYDNPDERTIKCYLGYTVCCFFSPILIPLNALGVFNKFKKEAH